MSDSRDDVVKTIIYSHHCPACTYRTREEYEERSTYLQTYSRWNVSSPFQKEKDGQKPFDRFTVAGRVLLACPNCGAVSIGDICEQIISES